MDASSVIDTLREALPGATIDAGPAVDMPTIYVDREHLVPACLALRDNPALQFALLVDVTAVDFLPAQPRFEIVYHLACLGAAFGSAPARRLRMKVRVPNEDTRVMTVTGVYPTAGWHEREVFDLFGITFEGHADLRRILTPEDWEGFPLRKDYPVQIRKDSQSWEPVQITPQEFAETIRAQRAQASKDSAAKS
jgi:NADH-quinone oxidoreductase subunit C